LDEGGVAAHSVHAGDVHLGDASQVVGVGLRRRFDGQLEVERPAASDDEFGDVRDVEAGGSGRAFAGEESGERHGAGGVAALVQAHGAHFEPGEPAGAGVSSGVVCRYSRPGKYELAWLGPEVHLAADVVPDAGGFELPFVDELGSLSAKDQAWVDADGVEGRVVGIEVDLASGEALGGEGLTTSFRAFE